jgi:two-component system, OmpR family, sensor histidine kinase VicK
MNAHYLVVGGIVVTAGSLLSALIYLRYISIKRHSNNTSNSHSEIKLADALRDEKLRSEIILNAIDDGVVWIDTHRKIQLFNGGASKITGWSPDEALSLESDLVIKLVDKMDQPYADKDNPFHKIFKTNSTIRDDKAILVTRSNKRIAISLTVSPLFEENKQVSAAVAIFRDISQQRNEELRRGEFISTASHEMRTPVAAIEGYLALALNSKVATIDTRARDFLEKAHASTQHLGQLFQDLLTSSKAEDGRLSNHPIIIELGSFLQQLTNDLKFGAQKKGLQCEFRLGAGTTIDASTTGGERVIKPLYYVQADPDRLREVITNLFDNAVKYTEQGTITVGLTGNKDVVQFFIRDTGPGIAREDVPHLFQKFYRVDTSATRTIGGTGLGLFICRKIIELYDGHIWVDSDLGKGSSFYINLPRLSTAKAEQSLASSVADNNLSTTNLTPPTAS